MSLSMCLYSYASNLGNAWHALYRKLHIYHVRLCIENKHSLFNKEHLGNLIAATGLVILLKLDSNDTFFGRATL